MGVVVAIVGRRRVGKSLLIDHIVSQGDNIQHLSFTTYQDLGLIFDQDGKHIVEIPSDSPIQDWENLPWHAVIVVDCPDSYQLQYGNVSENIYPREAYIKVATDVFLNTVAIDHVAWVAKQLVRSYFIV